jgi:hypothetical protein
MDKGYAVPEEILICDRILCFHNDYHDIDSPETLMTIDLRECDLYYRNIHDNLTDVYEFIPIGKEDKVNLDNITLEFKNKIRELLLYS